jgi:hypothetical protein
MKIGQDIRSFFGRKHKELTDTELKILNYDRRSPQEPVESIAECNLSGGFSTEKVEAANKLEVIC